MAENPFSVLSRQKHIVLFIAVFAGFITPFDSSSVNIALPTIGSAFHMDAISLSWVATVYLLTSAVFLVPFGKIADIYGRKRVFLYGIGLFTIASFAMTLVPSAGALILVRALQGIGGSMIYGTSVAILTSVYPPGERGRALGIYITAVYMGLSLGPFLGGLLTTSFGWKSIFLVNIPLGTLACLLTAVYLKQEWAECQGEKLDLPGSALYGLSMVTMMYGFSILPHITGIILTSTGFLLVLAFIGFEHRQKTPVLDIRLFSASRVFAFSNLAALINYSATYAVSFLLSLYLQFSKGFSPQYAGFVLVAAPVCQMIISPFSGKISDRVNSQIIASVGMAFCAFGLFLFVFVNDDTPIWFILAALIILGSGFGLFTSPNTNAIMSSVEKRYYGVASGIVGTMRLLGQMFSMGITMVLFSLIIGRVEITSRYYPAFMTTMHVGFLLFTVLCIIGIFASLARGNANQGGTTPPA